MDNTALGYLSCNLHGHTELASTPGWLSTACPDTPLKSELCLFLTIGISPSLFQAHTHTHPPPPTQTQTHTYCRTQQQSSECYTAFRQRQKQDNDVGSFAHKAHGTLILQHHHRCACLVITEELHWSLVYNIKLNS